MPVTEVGALGTVTAIVVVVVDDVVVVEVVVVVVVVSGGGGATVVVVVEVVVVVDVVVVVEDVVVVVDDVVVVGGTVVVVVVLGTTCFAVVVVRGTVVVGANVVTLEVVDGANVVELEVVVGGKVVGPKLAKVSGEPFLTSTVVGVESTVISASFDTTSPCVGTNSASALYSEFFRSRSSIGDKPGLTSTVFKAGGKSIFVEFRSVSAVACFVTTVSLPSRATSRTCTWSSDVCVVITKLVGADELTGSTALAETCGVSWFTTTVKV